MSAHPLETAETLEGVTPTGRKYNPQTWDCNPASQDAIVEEYTSSPDRLHNDRAPNLAIQQERTEHRMVLFLRAQGKTPQEIADKMGFGRQWVYQICKQPWFKKRLLETIHAAGQEGVDSFLNGEMLPSLVALTEIRDDENAKNSDKIAAVNSLLDRGFGKAVQHIKTEKVVTADGAKDEMVRLERELQQLQEAQRAVGMNPDLAGKS